MNIEVHFLSTDLPVEVIARYESLLTAEELDRVNRFRFDADRRRALVSRGALRELLAPHVAREIVILEGPRGKPHLAGGGIEFNVSHSGELVAIALAKAPVGIDVERVRPLRHEAIRIARGYFSPEESERIFSATSPDDEFFDIWTSKEAVIKADGKGLGASLKSFTVPARSDHLTPVRGLECWAVRALPAPLPGYRAALAVSADLQTPIVSILGD